MRGLCLDKENACNWNAGNDTAGQRRGVDDVGFTRLLAQWLRDWANIDMRSLFAVGFSNGVATHRLASIARAVSTI